MYGLVSEAFEAVASTVQPGGTVSPAVSDTSEAMASTAVRPETPMSSSFGLPRRPLILCPPSPPVRSGSSQKTAVKLALEDPKAECMGRAASAGEGSAPRSAADEVDVDRGALPARDERKQRPRPTDGSMAHRCLQICERMQARVKSEDPFAVPSALPPSTGFRTRSTVGMMLNGTTIEFLVVGGPGYNCGQLDRGDTVLRVNTEAVTSETILQALVGDDVPGSELSLTVKKGSKVGDVRVVILQRIATELIADRRRTFELFTIIKDRASQLDDDKIPLTVDKCISLWTNMLVQDTYYHEKAMKRFKALQQHCMMWLEEMHDELSRGTAGCKSKSENSSGYNFTGAGPTHPLDLLPLDAEQCSKQLGSMRAELLESVALIRECIDESRAQEATDRPPESSHKESGASSFTPLSLKERVTRDAIERGIVRAERNYEQRRISRLEYDVDRLTGEVERWKRVAAAADVALQEAKAEASQRSAAAELWREKAEEAYRQKFAAEEQGRREKERDAAAHAQAQAERGVAARELEERLTREQGAWEKEKGEMHDRLVVVHDQLRATEEMVQQYQEKEGELGRQLDEHQHQVEILKTELQKRTRSFDMQIERLEQELSELDVRSSRGPSREELNASLAAAQSYLQNMSRMQEESSAIHRAAKQLHLQFEAVARGCDDPEGTADEWSALTRTDPSLAGLSSCEYFGGVAELLSHLQRDYASVRTLCAAAARDVKERDTIAREMQELEDALKELGLEGRGEIHKLGDKIKMSQDLQDQVKRLESALKLREDEAAAACEHEKASKAHKTARELDLETEITQLKGVNELLVSDMSLMEKEATALKGAEYGRRDGSSAKR